MTNCGKCGHPVWAHFRGKCYAVNQRLIREYETKEALVKESEIVSECAICHTR